MPRRIQLIVLCEDSLHTSFASTFLSRIGLPENRGARAMRPVGDKATVQKRFPGVLREIIKRGGESHLIVIMDADERNHAANRKALIDELTEDERAKAEKANWLLISPAWEMENWCRHLEGVKGMTEKRDRTIAYKNPGDCKDAASKLADECKAGKLSSEKPLPSLAEACKEWNAYCQNHNL